MSLFIINFDLKENKKQYKTLFNELSNIGALQLTNKSWFIKRYNKHATYIRNYFMPFIYENDSLFVCKVKEFAPYNTKSLPKDITY